MRFIVEVHGIIDINVGVCVGSCVLIFRFLFHKIRVCLSVGFLFTPCCCSVKGSHTEYQSSVVFPDVDIRRAQLSHHRVNSDMDCPLSFVCGYFRQSPYLSIYLNPPLPTSTTCSSDAPRYVLFLLVRCLVIGRISFFLSQPSLKHATGIAQETIWTMRKINRSQTARSTSHDQNISERTEENKLAVPARSATFDL